jgi:tRNA A37 methylthiotransferase MiaB
MKLISLVQPNFQTGPRQLNVFFLPYSAGCVWAYAAANQSVAENFNLDQIIWKRQSVDEIVPRLALNDVVIFSTYVWNRQYNYTVAKNIKKINPCVEIIFGGPEPAVNDSEFFIKHPYIDYVVKKEGEQIFLSLLLHIIDPNSTTPKGLLINQGGTVLDTGDAERIADLSILPSPYLTGVFDKIVSANPDIKWSATLETNRGCPYQCTFCDWGSLTYNKVKQFPIEKVYAEIDWIGDHCDGVYVADANFGMFVERDGGIVEKIINTHKNKPGLNYFYINWAKNQKTEVIELIKKFTNETDKLVSNGLTVSVQSTTPEVLDIIKRTNLRQHKIKEIFQLAEDNKVPVYTELIMGLPGETHESFKDTVYHVIECGNHYGIDIFHCQLLENSELSQVQREVYNIKTTKWSDYISPLQAVDQEDNPDIVENIEVVVETSTMPKQQMLNTASWSAFMMMFHFYGFSTQISQFLKKYNNKSYKDFYTKLYQTFCQDVYFKNIYNQLRENYQDLFDHGKIKNPLVTITSYNAINISSGLLTKVHVDQRVDYTFEFLKRFLQDHCQLPEIMINQLIDYQRQITFTFDKIKNHQGTTVDYDYDFYGYLNHDQQLTSLVQLKFIKTWLQQEQTFENFINQLYFRKKQRIGLLLVEKQQ